jgi:hypothetical protein
MDGPFKLSKEEIAKRVTQASPGNFALGRVTRDKRFIVRYVGRDDIDIRRALLGALNSVEEPTFVDRLMGSEPAENYFKFSVAKSPVAAFEKHCRQYHKFNHNGNLRNKRHPRPPGSMPLICPVCDRE